MFFILIKLENFEGHPSCNLLYIYFRFHFIFCKLSYIASLVIKIHCVATAPRLLVFKRNMSESTKYSDRQGLGFRLNPHFPVVWDSYTANINFPQPTSAIVEIRMAALLWAAPLNVLNFQLFCVPLIKSNNKPDASKPRLKNWSHRQFETKKKIKKKQTSL